MSSTGISTLHGPHQVAKKLSTVGFPSFRVSLKKKFFSVISLTKKVGASSPTLIWDIKLLESNIVASLDFETNRSKNGMDVGSIVANLGFEAVRTSSGMEVIYRNVGNVADVGEIEACDTDNVEDVANVVE